MAAVMAISDAWASEGDDFIKFTVRLSEASTSRVSAKWDIDYPNATASYYDDYQYANGTVVFEPGEVETTIAVGLADLYNLKEALEYFVVQLGVPTSGVGIGKYQGTGYIVDDDAPPVANPFLSLASLAPTTVREVGRWIDIPVVLSAPGTEVQRVAYATHGGSAIAGQDYMAASGTLVFQPGEMTKTVRVLIRDDYLFDAAETFRLDFTSAGAGDAATPGGLPLSVRITIADNEVPIIGGPGANQIGGSDRPDVIKGLGGNDRIYGFDGNDTLAGGTGNDLLFGGRGSDRLFGGDGNDQLDGNGGVDEMTGGRGNDTYVVDHTYDVVTELAGEGTDTVFASASYRLATGVNNLALEGAGDIDGTGNRSDNLLQGNSGDNDLTGGLGSDGFRGGAGNDRFVFRGTSDSITGTRRDTIHDFERGEDKLDLRQIDAHEGRSGDQAFDFIGRDGFDGTAGQLRFRNGIVAGDTDGDGGADFQIALEGITNLSALNFLL